MPIAHKKFSDIATYNILSKLEGKRCTAVEFRTKLWLGAVYR